MEIKRWCMTAQKTRFQQRILNVLLGKSHIAVWALNYSHHLRCEKFLQVGKRTWFPIISEIN